ETINSKQHGNSFGSSFLTARNQGLESVGNANSIHIGSNNTQITSASVGGDPLCNAIVHDSSPNVTVVLEVGDHTHTRNSSASSAESIGEVSDGGGANVLRGGIQSRLKVSVILHVDLQASDIAPILVLSQSACKDGRFASSRSDINIAVISVGGGVSVGLSAASQHRHSHNASQDQRSNLLEFHSGFFLLMVYKR